LIVSHEHRFIFLKTRKTAGTSIEAFLEPYAGERAIVTPLGPDDDAHGHTPRNWRHAFNPVPELMSMPWVPVLSDLKHRRAFFDHIPARKLRTRLGRKTFDRYYKFCFERDPWDKSVSLYYWKARDGRPRPPFDEWALSRGLPTDWDLYTIDDGIAVDFVGRYDNLEHDLRTALDDIGIDATIELPRLKGDHRPRDAQPRFTPEVNAHIAGVFRREIDAFGFVDRSLDAVAE